MIFLIRSTWATDKTLKSTTIPIPSGPGSNGNEEDFTLPRSLELEFYFQMQFSVIPFLCVGRFYPSAGITVSVF